MQSSLEEGHILQIFTSCCHELKALHQRQMLMVGFVKFSFLEGNEQLSVAGDGERGGRDAIEICWGPAVGDLTCADAFCDNNSKLVYHMLLCQWEDGAEERA